MDKIPSHRRWRGVSDTLTDFIWWLRTWKKMLIFLLSRPLKSVQGLSDYGLAEAFISVPSMVDSFIGSAAGARLREKHEEISAYLESCFVCAGNVFCAEKNAVYVEGECAETVMRGFPWVKSISVPVALPLFAGEGKSLPDVGTCAVLRSEQSRRYFTLPVFVLGSGSGEIIECVRFLEKHTGEKFDWDAFTEYLSTAAGEDVKSPAEAVELTARRYL